MPKKKQYAKLAVVGRPNVGKSTLFNRLLKEKKSIVDDSPGVTRDRLYAEIEWNGKGITLIDTGGLIEESNKNKDEIVDAIRTQAYSAIKEADYVLFLVDGTSGVVSLDEKIAGYLRKIKDKKKIFLGVNKIDTEKQNDLVYEFYSLGLGDPYPLSALSGSAGLADILDEVAKTSIGIDEISDDNLIKVAIVGKPNVGKSSILNCLIGEERAIVSSIPGTTRDIIDTTVNINDINYLLIDTAGLRKKSKVSTNIERYATTRTISAIEKSDVVLLVVSSDVSISDQEQKIASVIKKRNKASIVLVNKWDLIVSKSSSLQKEYEEEIFKDLHFINYSKLLFASALKNKNLNKIWNLVNEVYENYKKRISTGKLNRVLEEIFLSTPPPTKKGKLLKVYYATQSGIKPPQIVFFVNDSTIVSEQYKRFLEKEIRKCFDFSGSPIDMVFRNKKDS